MGISIVSICLFLLASLAQRGSCEENEPSKVLRYAQCGDVHAFYYLWYGNPLHDDQWKHWDHEVLPHWTAAVNAQYPDVGKRFEPPGYIHSPFYPQLGPYSSRDELAIRRHFDMLLKAGVDVVVVSWWGRVSRDSMSSWITLSPYLTVVIYARSPIK